MNELTREDPQYGSTISVARCYMVKNRQPDVCPFDKTRYASTGTRAYLEVHVSGFWLSVRSV